MNFLNLKYFIITAEEMNFTRAANRHRNCGCDSAFCTGSCISKGDS